MQRGHLRVGAGVREVDRVPDAVLSEALAGVEVPAEEGVDRQRDLALVLHVRLREVVVLLGVALVQGRRRVVLHHADVRADPDAADEVVVG